MVTPPPLGADWREALRIRTVSARAAMHRYPRAITLMETRVTPGPATLGHHDAVIGCLCRSGFSVPMAAHAFAVLDAFMYGFAMEEATMPFSTPEESADLAANFLAQFPAERYPHLAELTVEHVLAPGYDYGQEFEFGLGLILDGLAQAHASGD